MDCRIPPPLSDDQLSSALDGDADTEVQAHLTACPSCTARLEQARRIEQGLRKLAFWDCPSPEELGEYELAMLDTAASQAVAAHLGGCGRCRAELEDLRALLGTPEPAARPAVPAAAPRPTPLRARLGELIARLLPAPAAPALALRGAASRTLTAEAGDLTLMLDMTDAGQGVRIEGQLIGDALDPWLGAVVELRQGGALQSAALVDEFGGFSLGPLPAAPADLRITGEHGGTILLKYEV